MTDASRSPIHAPMTFLDAISNSIYSHTLHQVWIGAGQAPALPLKLFFIVRIDVEDLEHLGSRRRKLR